MKRLILALILCMAASLAEAKCPGDPNDGKRVTVTGRIFYADKQDAKYFFGLEECRILVHAKNNGKGACKIGRTLTATGTFYVCDMISECFKEFGDMDAIDASRITCR
jgi:hypothetical protein